MKRILLLLAILLGNVAITRAQDAIISLIGAGITDWSTDLELETFDGVTYSLEGVEFKGGDVKFRQDNNWDINWGGVFPSAIGEQNGSNIPVPAGIWNVTFSLETFEYSFVAPEGAPAVVTIYGTALGKASINLTSADGENYSTTAQIYTNGVLTVSSFKDGVTTLSYLLGKKGTFIFSAMLFDAATAVLYRLLATQDQIKEIARQILPESPTLAVVGPFRSTSKFERLIK